MKLKKLVGVAFLAACGSAMGSVSLGFSSVAADNFANQFGNPTNDMFAGVIIDTGANGFLSSYTEELLVLDGIFELKTAGGANTDDVLVIGSFLTYADVNDGTIYDVSALDITQHGLAAGQAFRVIWFDGNVAGTLADTSFTLPSEGSLQDYPIPFNGGNNPIRSAGLAYTGTSGTSTGPGISFVPEPSTALLGAVGALCLLRRRRN